MGLRLGRRHQARGVPLEQPGRPPVARSGIPQRALEHEVEEQRALLPDLVEGLPLSGSDQTQLREAPGPDDEIHAGQGVVTAVEQPVVEVGTPEQGEQRGGQAVDLGDGREVAEEAPALAHAGARGALNFP